MKKVRLGTTFLMMAVASFLAAQSPNKARERALRRLDKEAARELRTLPQFSPHGKAGDTSLSPMFCEKGSKLVSHLPPAGAAGDPWWTCDVKGKAR